MILLLACYTKYSIFVRYRPNSRSQAPLPSELGYLTLGDGGGDVPGAVGLRTAARSGSADRLEAFMSDLVPTAPESARKPLDVITDTEVERNWGPDAIVDNDEVFFNDKEK